MTKGFIKLHRDVQDHWIWQDSEPFTKRSAWIDMLMRANHKPNKLPMSGEIVTLERGQFLCSERNIAEDWLWSRTKLRNFWQLLKSDNMINLNKNHGKTIVTICNYDDWQGEENHEETKGKPTGDQEETTREPGEDRNKKVKNDQEGEEVKTPENSGGDNDDSPDESEPDPYPDASPEYVELSRGFHEYQQSEYPNLIKDLDEHKIMQGADTLGKLERLDGYSYEEIHTTLQFIANDKDFWATKVLSLSQIRKKGRNDEMKFVNAMAAMSSKNGSVAKKHHRNKKYQEFVQRDE